jgi:hypothetical protein
MKCERKIRASNPLLALSLIMRRESFPFFLWMYSDSPTLQCWFLCTWLLHAAALHFPCQHSPLQHCDDFPQLRSSARQLEEAGAFVGLFVGLAGAFVGRFVGLTGAFVGATGFFVGVRLGAIGFTVGFLVGVFVGVFVGAFVGFLEG